MQTIAPPASASPFTLPSPPTVPLRHTWSLYHLHRTYNFRPNIGNNTPSSTPTPTSTTTTPNTTTTTAPTPANASAESTTTTGKPTGKAASAAAPAATAYSGLVEHVTDFADARTFWNVYTHLKPVSALPPVTDVSYFRSGIQPAWEDPANIHGGKVRFTPTLCSCLFPIYTFLTWSLILLVY